MNTNAAHTAEHAFIRSLQKILKKTLNVRKVEHRESYNVAFIESSELDLDFDKIVLAEEEVNRLIIEGRNILHHSFPSLAEAKKKIPELRANEERLASADNITVVEIENHDVAACSMKHVSNLSECIFFLVTSMSMNGSDYEIKFVVGKNAMDEAVKITEKINVICNEIGANYNTVEETIKKLNKEREQYHDKLKILTNKILTSIHSQYIEKYRINIISKILDNIDWRMIQTFVGEKIREARTIVILVNTDDNDMASLVFARSSDINLDCVSIFENIGKRRDIGKGGGKSNFVNAQITKSMSNKVVEDLVKESLKVLSL